METVTEHTWSQKKPVLQSVSRVNSNWWQCDASETTVLHHSTISQSPWTQKWFSYPMFVSSGLPWTTIRNECTKWRRWLDSDEAKTLSTDDYSSSSFWKGTLPPYRETIDIDDSSIASPESFHSIEDGGGRDDNQSTQDDMILSSSIVNLNIK